MNKMTFKAQSAFEKPSRAVWHQKRKETRKSTRKATRKSLSAAAALFFCWVLFSPQTSLGACVKLGLLGEFSRFNSKTAEPFGREIERGVRVALDRLRARPSRICPEASILDIRNSVANIPDVMKRARSEQGIQIFLGVGSSDQAIIAHQAVKGLDAVLITPTATSDKLNQVNTKVILMSPRDSFIASSLAQSALQRGIRSVGAIYAENSEYSRDITRNFVKSFANSGGTIAFQAAFRSGQLSDEWLTQIDVSHVQEVFLPLYELEAANVISYLIKKYPTVRFIGTDSWGTYSSVLRRFVGDVKVTAIFPLLYSAFYPGDANKRFLKHYQMAFGELPSDLAAFSYDGVLLVNQALGHCSLSKLVSATSDCVKESLPFDSTTGRIEKMEGSLLLRRIEIRPFQ